MPFSCEWKIIKTMMMVTEDDETVLYAYILIMFKVLNKIQNSWIYRMLHKHKMIRSNK